MDFMLKKRWLWILAVVLVVGGFWWRKKIVSDNKNIESTEIKRGVVKEELILSGQIKAVEHANLSFLSSGELSWVGVKRGDQVKKGQALARLNTTALYQQYEQAVADLRKTQATADKVLDEVKDHDDDETMTQKDTRTTAEANRDKAYRALEIAKKNLADGYIRAPFAGLVTNVVFPFANISTNYTQSQIEILNPETMYFEVLADQTEVGGLAVGQKVAVVLDSYLEEEFLATVTSVGYTPKTGEANIVYEVKLEFENMNTDKFRVGMTGDARFVLREARDVLYVPVEFLNSDTKGKYLKKKIKNGKVYIETGLEGEDLVEVKGEIKEGNIVYD